MDIWATCRGHQAWTHTDFWATPVMGSQHPSPNVKKTLCNFEAQIWLEMITSRDAKSACFKGSRTSCREIIFGIFWPNFGQKRSHHVMDAFCLSQTFSTLGPKSWNDSCSWSRKTPNAVASSCLQLIFFTVKSSPTPHPTGSCRGLPFNSPLDKPRNAQL